MAACSNATKYARTYIDFNVNNNYPVINDRSPRFVLQQQYWNSKVLSYEVQGRCQKRDTTDNVKEQDFEYFKQLFKVSKKWVTGGLSNVMHRVNVERQDFIKKFEYDSINKNVRVVTSNYQITPILGIDFISLYPSVISSEYHKFIKYTSGKMYMPGSVSDKVICDSVEKKQKILDIINSQNRYNDKGQLFIEEVKGHIDDTHINDYIIFPPIQRNYEFQTNEETVDEYMNQHMKSNGLKVDQKQRKLTNLLSTMGGYMTFSSYYLWFLIDDCHFMIDDVKQIILFNKHDKFSSFAKEFTNQRIYAKINGNKGLEQFCKIIMKSSYGSDGMNIEKYTKIKMMNEKQALQAHLSNTFMVDQKLSDNVYAVQMNPEKCSCRTPLQVAYFVLDLAKYWYLNFIYNFMYKCFDMNKLHFIEGDTDSAYWAVSGNKNESYKQQFKYFIKDQQFYNENAKYFFPTIEGDMLDEKKTLGLAIEREGIEMIALAPKNYYIMVDVKTKIKLKGINQSTNKITKGQIVENIIEGTVTKCQLAAIRALTLDISISVGSPTPAQLSSYAWIAMG
ncbi:MAG: hypothetical protein EZS28_019419 [Streblomastix strix]|uniref:Uncharacterized protein n=1 Tax=Streblomastix strix TaxID=222440 RepID=A0A5J4VR91_9EUKA|nr:MAG: hypothetical protein EZS28_019419 [Streblomastix strix]